MRREQVMKICANHLLAPQMTLSMMGGKVKILLNAVVKSLLIT